MGQFKHIISIHGAPRSGTSWLGQIMDSSPDVRYKFQPLFSYAFKERINLKSSPQEIYDYYNDLYGIEDEFLDQNDKKRKGIYPIFIEKEDQPNFLITKMVRYHYLLPYLLENVDYLKGIGIVRHPCGVLNSWGKAPREFLEEWDFDFEWRFAQSKNKFRPEEYYGFQRWKESTKLFMEMEKTYPDKMKLIVYEDLLKNPLEVTRQIYSFCGLRLTQQTIDFIELSTTKNQQDEYSVFKGKKVGDDWKVSLDHRIITSVYRELEGTELGAFLHL